MAVAFVRNGYFEVILISHEHGRRMFSKRRYLLAAVPSDVIPLLGLESEPQVGESLGIDSREVTNKPYRVRTSLSEPNVRQKTAEVSVGIRPIANVDVENYTASHTHLIRTL